MKKILALLVGVLLFIACDFAKESVKLKPDIEVAFVNPVAGIINGVDSVVIEEIKIVSRNSVECTRDRMVWEYYTIGGERFFGPFQVPIYMKIKGIVDPAEVDTSILENVPLPVDTVWNYLTNPDHLGYEAKALIHFIAFDDYKMGNADTATFWFGLFRTP